MTTQKTRSYRESAVFKKLTYDDLHPDLQKRVDDLIDANESNMTKVELHNFIRGELGWVGLPASGRRTKGYWTRRGWNGIPPHVNMSRKGHSPFSAQHWIEKGYTAEEAEFMRNSIRPIRKEYWIVKGFSESEAIKKAKEVKASNNKKGAESSKARPMIDHRTSSKRCIEYWIAFHKGDVEKAHESLSNHQTNFSLSKCVEKYGEEGYDVWLKRQIQWQKSLNENNDMDEVNSKKLSTHTIGYYTQRGISFNDASKRLYETGRYKNESELVDSIRNDPLLSLYSPEALFDKISESQLCVVGIATLEDMENFMARHDIQQYKSAHYTKGFFTGYILKVPEGTLRSSYEIALYNLIKDSNLGEIDVDGTYPDDSSFRYDIYLKEKDLYIEVCPMYNVFDDYTERMNRKVEQHNSKRIIRLTCSPDAYPDIVKDLEDDTYEMYY